MAPRLWRRDVEGGDEGGEEGNEGVDKPDIKEIASDNKQLSYAATGNSRDYVRYLCKHVILNSKISIDSCDAN